MSENQKLQHQAIGWDNLNSAFIEEATAIGIYKNMFQHEV